MPYVNIPNSKLGGAVAKIVGKLQGQIVAKAQGKVGDMVNKLTSEACPATDQLARLRKQKEGIDSALKGIQNKLAKFKKIPPKLKAPASGIKKAIKIILALPIPQSVPPGFGIPVNISMKFANILHLLKELVSQIEELIESIETVLKTPATILGSITGTLGKLDGALRCCEIEKALEDQLASGAISANDLSELGLLNDDGTTIFSSLGPKMLANTSGNVNKGGTASGGGINNGTAFGTDGDVLGGDGTAGGGAGGSGAGGLGAGSGIDDIYNTSLNNDKKYRGKWLEGVEYLKDDVVSFIDTRWRCTQTHVSNLNGGKESGPPPVGPWEDIQKLEDLAFDELLKNLDKIQGSRLPQSVKDNIQALLDSFKSSTKQERDESPDFYHTGPDGINYKLEIKPDPNSPQIAPRRYAVGINPEGVEVYKGQKSFSSSTKVLLDEIKFRIDNQLS